MARAGIFYEEVRMAADKLVAQGETPTLARLRTELGGTGSFSTIARHLAAWRSAVQVQSADPSSEKRPAALEFAVERVWGELQQASAEQKAQIEAAAQQEIEQAKQEAAALVETAQQERTAAQTLLQASEQRLELALEEMKHLRLALSESQAALAVECERSAHLQSQRIADQQTHEAERRAVEERLNVGLENLRKERDVTLLQITDMTERWRRARRDHEASLQELLALREKLDEERRARTAMDHALHELRAEEVKVQMRNFQHVQGVLTMQQNTVRQLARDVQALATQVRGRQNLRR